MELKIKIRETLLEERKRKLQESFNELETIEDDNFLIERYLSIYANLLEEGYSINEIEDIKTQLNKVDWKKAMGDGAITIAKEYAIRYVVKEVFGANPGFATTAAQVLSRINPLDLLKPFKDEQSCNKYFPQISDALIIALLRYIGSEQIGSDRNDYGLTSGKGLTTSLVGNLFGEIVEQSNISETISSKFCKMIH